MTDKEAEKIDIKSEEPENEAAKLLAECAEYKIGWQRALADYQNLQKETAREREEFARFALERTLRDFLDVADRGSAALAESPQDVNDHTKEWIRGVRLIFDGFTSVLASYGVIKIEAVGKPFDPMHYEAVGSRHVPEQDSGIVLEETRSGYMLNGRVLRPAQVIISE